MVDPLKLALDMARKTRDCWNLILTIGIVVEVFCDAFWPERSILVQCWRAFKSNESPFKWRFEILTKKGIVTLLAGLTVVVGLYKERSWGHQADLIADKMQTDLEIKNQALLIMATGRQIIETPRLDKLAEFKGVTGNVVTSNMLDHESFTFAGQLLAALQDRHWRPAALGPPSVPIQGIDISTRRISRDDPMDCGAAPYQSLDQKTCVAGVELEEYLTSIGIEAHHENVPPALVPIGEVQIVVGPRGAGLDKQLLRNLEETLRKYPQESL
jgi:hypothetical protein